MRRALVVALLALLALPAPPASSAEALVLREPVNVRAAAVAQTSEGFVGSLADVSIAVADGGSGHIFVDTFPLTQVDMQGSARLAVKVAASIAGVDPHDHDFFFTVRSGSSVIGGPSAGAVLTVGALAALANLTLDPSVLMTGTVNLDGTIGPVGGVPEKAAAAAAGGARVFLMAAGQETVRERRGAQIVEVNVTAYCAEELNILCRPVVDVQEAILLATGHDFRRPHPTNVTDETFRKILRPKGGVLLQQAEVDLAAARATFEGAGGLGQAEQNDLSAFLTEAAADLTAARAAQDRGEYYTTASQAFQSAISSRYVNWSVAYLEGPDASAWWTATRRATAEHVAGVEADARDADWSTVGQLDGVGAAQSKASEARFWLERADALLATGRPLEAVYSLAFAWERADTVPWWLAIAAETPPGAPVDEALARETARDVIDAAREAVVYAQTIVHQVQVSSGRLLDASRLVNMSSASLALGQVPGALVQALEAEGNAAIALTLSGYGDASEIPKALVDSARARAGAAIQDARASGIEPVLAVSYYEFGGAVDRATALQFYGSAHATASLDQVLSGTPRRAPESRFVGEDRLPDVWVPKEHLVAFFALGVATGVAAAVGSVVLSRDEKLTED